MQPTLVAVATADGVSVCDHLARSTSFLLFQIADGRAVSDTVRTRSTGACGQHRTFVELLDGCQSVLCGGIGQGAADALAANGIQTVVIGGPLTVQEAVERYLAGTLVVTDERVCLCH